MNCGIMLGQVFFGGSLVQWAIWIVLIAAVVALVLLALRNFGISVPPFARQALWIVLIAVVVIVAIIFVARVAGSL